MNELRNFTSQVVQWKKLHRWCHVEHVSVTWLKMDLNFPWQNQFHWPMYHHYSTRTLTSRQFQANSIDIVLWNQSDVHYCHNPTDTVEPIASPYRHYTILESNFAFLPLKYIQMKWILMDTSNLYASTGYYLLWNQIRFSASSGYETLWHAMKRKRMWPNKLKTHDSPETRRWQ